MAKKKSYYELLQDPRWQKKRLEVMERAGFACQHCGDTVSTLNVHHNYYEKNKMPWEYKDETLVCLCKDCHKEHETQRLKMMRMAGNLDFREREELIGYLIGKQMDENSEKLYYLFYIEHLLGVSRYFRTSVRRIEESMNDAGMTCAKWIRDHMRSQESES